MSTLGASTPPLSIIARGNERECRIHGGLFAHYGFEMLKGGVEAPKVDIRVVLQELSQ